MLLCFIYINGILGAVILSIWGERRLYARFQNRSGPNRWGPMGILTSTADAIKVMFKEDIVPQDADKFLFNLAPVLMVFPVFMVFSVIIFFKPFSRFSYSLSLNGNLALFPFESLK